MTYIRKRVYHLQTVFARLAKHTQKNKRAVRRKSYLDSTRLQVFKRSGTQCVTCGLSGSFFALERFPQNRRYHVNLYGISQDGQEVMLTRDHIIPRSKGGKDRLDNQQTMCAPCNKTKGNQYEKN